MPEVLSKNEVAKYTWVPSEAINPTSPTTLGLSDPAGHASPALRAVGLLLLHATRSATALASRQTERLTLPHSGFNSRELIMTLSRLVFGRYSHRPRLDTCVISTAEVAFPGFSDLILTFLDNTLEFLLAAGRHHVNVHSHFLT